MNSLTPESEPNRSLRRQMLQSIAVGFGGLGLTDLLCQEAMAVSKTPLEETASSTIAKPPLFPARAKRVIFLFMHGGPSHVDTFDYKPALAKYDGKPLPFKGSRVVFAQRGNLMKSPWKFRQVGTAGHWMSDLWQHLPEVADDLCMIHSMCETNVSHGGACMKMHTGSESLIRPSLGSWISYGLGTDNQNLPGFITICPTSLHGGVNNFGSSFLPAIHQGVPYGTPGYPNKLVKEASFPYVTNQRLSLQQQKRQIELLRNLRSLNREEDNRFEARIKSFELAFRMQMAAPETVDLTTESEATRKLYGLDQKETENFGTQCLLARRFAERGVRFIQVSHAHSLKFNNEQWDQHSHLEKGHTINCKQIDLPITGLIKDLKQRGLLEDTLVIWGGEFGRTPTTQKSTPVGRDHHPEGFTIWMAGGGIQGGKRYGSTDEFGYYAQENRCTLHDWHATILHLMGLDHEKLTYLHAGRNFRLTDVFGNVVKEIIV
ncbi:MAG: DUF1501 domain-containing protein [Planctomycetota bacterium]|nr:DUF1501 domain-containing protein [Planctomycetota bacterium]